MAFLETSKKTHQQATNNLLLLPVHLRICNNSESSNYSNCMLEECRLISQTYQPTDLQTNRQTNQPTNEPTYKQTDKQPTNQPTDRPSDQPNNQPTNNQLTNQPTDVTNTIRGVIKNYGECCCRVRYNGKAGIFNMGNGASNLSDSVWQVSTYSVQSVGCELRLREGVFWSVP